MVCQKRPGYCKKGKKGPVILSLYHIHLCTPVDNCPYSRLALPEDTALGGVGEAVTDGETPVTASVDRVAGVPHGGAGP